MISAHNINMKNFWSGEWLSTWELETGSNKVKGNIRANTYYYEDETFEQETEEQSDDIEDDSIGKDVTTAVVTALRDELKKKEYLRDYLRFRYKGEVCDGVPMAEIDPSKFVFKIDDRLVGVKLGEIKIL